MADEPSTPEPRTPEPSPAEDVPDKPRRLRPSLFLKIGLTVLVLWLVVRGIDFRRLGAVILGADPWLMAFAVLYTVALNGIKPFRWLWLIRGVVPATTYRIALRSTLFGAGARLVLPSKIGEFGRVLEVPGLKILTGVGLTALDLLMEISAAFFVAIPGALIFAGPGLATVFVFLTLIPTVALFWPHRVLFPLVKLPGLRRLHGRLAAMREVVHHIGKPTLAKGLAVSVLLNGIRFSQLYVLFIALGSLPKAPAVLCFPLIQLADGFPLTVGGVGVREWLSMQVLPAYGILAEAAVAAVFLQFIISNLLPGVAGWWIIYRGRAEAGAKIRDAVSAVVSREGRGAKRPG